MMDSKEKLPVSLCIIARNEAQNLKRCFENVSSVVSEILLLDTGSNDGTAEVAKALGAQVFGYEWNDDYSAARNFLLQKTQNDWVLWVDGDEYYSRELMDEIRSKIFGDKDLKGYYFPRKNYYFGKWMRYGGNYPDYQLKLFLKSASSKFQSRVHEKIEISGKTGYLSTPCDHYPYPTLNSYFSKFGVYTTLDAMKLMEKGVNISFMNTILWVGLKPSLRFFKRYILKGGFLNGIPGLFAALFDSAGIIVRYIKLWELQKGKNSI